MEPRSHEEPGDEGEAPTRRGAIVALLVVVVLLIAGLLLAQHLRHQAALQDCLAAGRTNCAKLVPERS